MYPLSRIELFVCHTVYAILGFAGLITLAAGLDYVKPGPFVDAAAILCACYAVVVATRMTWPLVAADLGRIAALPAIRRVVKPVVVRAESWFTPLPTLTRAEVEAGESGGSCDWDTPEVYYGLDQGGDHLSRRVRALLTFDRAMVSFYRKREELRAKLKGWTEITA